MWIRFISASISYETELRDVESVDQYNSWHNYVDFLWWQDEWWSYVISRNRDIEWSLIDTNINDSS